MVCAAPLPRVPNTDAIGVASTSDFEALRSLVRRHVTRRNTREWLRGYVEATLRAGPLSFPVSQQRELREALGDEVRLSHLQAEAEGAYAEAEDALHRATPRGASARPSKEYFVALEFMASVRAALYVLELPKRVGALELEIALCQLATGLGVSDQAVVDRLTDELIQT